MNTKGASLFPVAKGVQVPFVGREVLDIKNVKLNATQNDKHPHETDNIRTSDGITLLKQLSEKQPGAFKDKSQGRINHQYLKTVSNGLTFSDDVLQERVKNSKPYSSNTKNNIFDDLKRHKRKGADLQGRHDPRYSVRRHCPCLFGESNADVSTSHTKTKPLPKIEQKPSAENIMGSNESKSKDIKSFASQKPQLTWDEYLITLLSKDTAEMIIKEHTFGQQQIKLNSVLREGKKPSLTVNNGRGSQTDTFLGENKHDVAKESAVPESKEKGLESNLKKDMTETPFLKRIKQGALPIHSVNTKSNEIILDSDSKTTYQKVLENSYPAETERWYDWQAKEKNSGGKNQKTKKTKVKKGMHKWKAYPEMIEESELQKMTLCSITPPAPRAFAELDLKTVKKQQEDANLVRIVQEWRSKWFLEKKWESSTTKELLNGMDDINDHVRLSAVSACSKALLNKKIGETKTKERSILSNNDDTVFNPDIQVDLEVLDKIFGLLLDRCQQVRVAASITLFALNKANQKAKEILLQVVAEGGPPERWAAAQCLAWAGSDSDVVISELMSHINSSDIVKHSKSVQMLGKLSKESTTVQYMLAEQLNSSSWRDRVVACQVFPSLQGPLSKDLANKISHLMWNDWSKDVRTAAARTLGRTGNGKLVHDKIRDRLMSGNETEILDALRKISYLGIMTGRLLPAFLDCFKSDYISIRLETVKTISAIRLTHEQGIEELLRLANEERNWKVKAHCIQAIGLVAKPTEKVQEVLLWCLRYEKESAIRAEACRAICNLDMRTDRVVNVLQDRIGVEEDFLVQGEVASTLNTFGLEPTGDLTMLKVIQTEVKRLCNRENIAGSIVTQDAEGKYKENKKKYLTNDEQSNSKSNSGIESGRSSSQRTSGGQTGRGFDPILEGYKIRNQSPVSVPAIPHVGDPVLQFDEESESGESDIHEDDDSMHNTQGINVDKTVAPFSTATLF